MPASDMIRWNQRYRQSLPEWLPEPREILVSHRHLLPSSGLALDLAMGLGQNTAFLQAAGINVIGTDISITAIRYARQNTLPPVPAFVADLEEFYFPRNCFDVILNLYYLQRDLFTQFAGMLKPHGLLIMETLTKDMLQVRPDLNPNYLLEKGELAAQFSSWEILHFQEGWQEFDHGKMKAVASLVARQPFTGG